MQDTMYAVTIELVELLDVTSMSLLWSHNGVDDNSMVRVEARALVVRARTWLNRARRNWLFCYGSVLLSLL